MMNNNVSFPTSSDDPTKCASIRGFSAIYSSFRSARQAYSSLFLDSTDNNIAVLPSIAVFRTTPYHMAPYGTFVRNVSTPLEPNVTLITGNNRRTSIPMITPGDDHDSHKCCGGNKNKCLEVSLIVLLLLFNLPMLFLYIALLGKHIAISRLSR